MHHYDDERSQTLQTQCSKKFERVAALPAAGEGGSRNFNFLASNQGVNLWGSLVALEASVYQHYIELSYSYVEI